jgi:hypothetical protein
VFVVTFLAVHPFQTQGTIPTNAPDWAPWLEYFLGALAEQKTRLAKRIERVTGANRKTVKDHLAALTRNRHLERHGAGRGAWYSLA